MTYFGITTRKEKDGHFIDQPGKPQFLIADTGATDFNTGQVTSKNTWLDKIKSEGLKDIIFYIHGFDDNQKTALNNHRLIEHGLRENGLENFILISYDWPSPYHLLQYRKGRKFAKTVSKDFISSGLDSFGSAYKLHIMAHSMGNLVLANSFTELKSNPNLHIDQIIMFAANVTYKIFEDTLGKDILKCSNRVTNYFNRDDKVLCLAGIISGRQLGKYGARNTKKLKETYKDKFESIDATHLWEQMKKNYRSIEKEIKEPIESHCFYYTDMVWFKDVVQTLQGTANKDTTKRLELV